MSRLTTFNLYMYRTVLFFYKVAQWYLPMQETQETRFQSLSLEDALEKEMATHSSILAWEIPWTEEPGGLQSMGSHRVGHDWAHQHQKQHCILMTPFSPVLWVWFLGAEGISEAHFISPVVSSSIIQMNYLFCYWMTFLHLSFQSRNLLLFSINSLLVLLSTRTATDPFPLSLTFNLC